jgi:protein ImuA
MSALLDQLSRRQLLWHGSSQQAAYQAVASGYTEVDQHLGGGWPANGVIDLQTETGIGELRLLLPYLQQQLHDGRLLVWVCPPAQPCADMLSACGISLSQLLIIRAKNSKDALWSAEQCLQSGCAAVVLLWQQQLNLTQARRLQLAATQGQATLVQLRRPKAGLSLPVTLSLQLSPHPQGVQLQVHKRRGGWPAQPFVVAMQQHWPALCLQNDVALPAQRRAG